LPTNFGKIGRHVATLASRAEERIRDPILHPQPSHSSAKEMARNMHKAISLIATEDDGDASRIRKGKPPSAKVVYRFLSFRGVDPKTMAVNSPARADRVESGKRSAASASSATQVRRSATCNRIRALDPEFCGLPDRPFRDIGRNGCRPQKPDDESCHMDAVCLFPPART